MADAPAPLPDHAGHRSRLRARLLRGDADGMADYELVEYLLALAIPRRDTKPLAKTLLREFGSFAQLVSADPESLRRIDGMGDGAIAALKIVQRASSAKNPYCRVGVRCSTGCAPTWDRSRSSACGCCTSTRATC
jgi:DNA repair protein RadC